MIFSRRVVFVSPIARLFGVSALCATIVLGLTGVVMADRPPSQPWVDDTIETALDACLSKAERSGATKSIENCYTIAENRYDVALDVAYRVAVKHIDTTSAARLRQTQATWLTYRKDVYDLIQAPWSGNRGTIVGSQMAQSEIIAQKARILEIKLIWPGFAEGDSPLEIGTESTK
jgi:uncharacterized protein YecT (DUF1311 family)